MFGKKPSRVQVIESSRKHGKNSGYTTVHVILLSVHQYQFEIVKFSPSHQLLPPEITTHPAAKGTLPVDVAGLLHQPDRMLSS